MGTLVGCTMYVHDIMKIEIMFKLSAILLFIVNFGNYKVSADTYMVCKSVENNDHPADFASSGDAPASIRLGNVGLQGPRGLPGPIGRTGQPGPMGPPGPAGNSLNAFDDIRSELDGIKEIVVALEKGNAALKKCTGSSTPFTYILSPMNVNWQQAQDYCISIGGNLAVHGVRGEMGKRQAIADEIIRSITDHRDTTPELWIGLNDKDREGVWKWIDGEPALTMQQAERAFKGCCPPDPFSSKVFRFQQAVNITDGRHFISLSTVIRQS